MDIASPPSSGQRPLLFAEPEPDQVVETAASEADPDDANATPAEGSAEIVPMTIVPVRGGQMVQHVGCWMLLALVNEFGLHDDAERAFKSHDGLRIARRTAQIARDF